MHGKLGTCSTDSCPALEAVTDYQISATVYMECARFLISCTLVPFGLSGLDSWLCAEQAGRGANTVPCTNRQLAIALVNMPCWNDDYQDWLSIFPPGLFVIQISSACDDGWTID
jgi:hypothetical protein